MDRESRRRFEAERRELSPPQNQVINDLNDGAFSDRGEFLKRGTMFGLSASVLSGALVAAGEAPAAFAKESNRTATGRLRVGLFPPPPGGGNLDPWTVLDSRLTLTHIPGEFLTRTLGNGHLVPELAVSWKPNADASVWTFKLRPNVKFQSGQTLSPEDVIATFKHLLDPATSQALSAFKGVLSPGNITKGSAGDEVVFKLDAGNASFPYFVSNTVYQCVILPSAYVPGTFASKPQGTGAYMFTKFNPGVSASYDAFPGWWRGAAGMQGVDVTIYSDTAPRDAAMLAGQLDIITGSVSVGASKALFVSPNVQIFTGRSSSHSEVVMRVDAGQPLADPRVRQAIAYSVNRPDAIVKLYGKYADIGNDTPFAPVYPMSVATKQRVKNIKLSKQLMAAAGKSKGLSIEMTIGNDAPQPQMGEILAAGLKEIGINASLKTVPDSVYYSGDQNTTPWLNTPFNITGWGSRPVPNVYLVSELHSGGIWNAPHIADKALDGLIDTYTTKVALKDQQKYALQIEKRVQALTPILYIAFTNNVAAGSKTVKRFDVEGNSFNVGKTTA